MSPAIKKPELPHIIIGTAGHVDHGKTSLIKLLTGCDTDRLKEEKARGLSIDLGFAPCMLPGNRVVGIVDVPGHIDFIRNMVAGAASIDILILVIAADDGIMPQTIEHLQIVKLLRTPRLMVALTKTDLVDQETLELAREEIQEFTIQMGYPDAPVIPVSNTSLEGIGQIGETIDELVKSLDPVPNNQPFRMNIERVFSLKGLGTVVTGIPISGQISVKDKVELLPVGISSSVRTIHNYKHQTDTTFASICSALNLRDVDVAQLERGMTVTTEGSPYQTTKAAMVNVSNISKKFTLKHNSEIRFYSGTAEVMGKINLIDTNSLTPGKEAVARIRFKEPLVLVGGDRFIIRKLSPSITIGGGVILANGDYRYKRSSAPFQQRLQLAAKAAAEGDYFSAALLAGKSVLPDKQELFQLTQLNPKPAEKLISEKITEKLITQLAKDCYLVNERVPDLNLELALILKKYHRNHKYSAGMALEQAAAQLNISSEGFKILIPILVKASSKVSLKNNQLSLTSFKPAISKKQLLAKENMFKLIQEAGINGITSGSIMKDLGIAKDDFQIISKILVEENEIVVISSHLMTSQQLQDCRDRLLKSFEENEIVDIRMAREVIGAGRNQAVAILEKFDSLGLTKRVEQGRKLANADVSI